MISFLVLGLIGVFWCNELFKEKILGNPHQTTEKKSTRCCILLLGITGVVFFITQILLFWFSFKYQYSEKRKSFYFPHNNKLEVIWTVVPAIALTVLVGFGLITGSRSRAKRPKMQCRWKSPANSLTGFSGIRERMLYSAISTIRISMTRKTIHWVYYWDDHLNL